MEGSGLAPTPNLTPSVAASAYSSGAPTLSTTTHGNRKAPFLYCINFLNNLK